MKSLLEVRAGRFLADGAALAPAAALGVGHRWANRDEGRRCRSHAGRFLAVEVNLFALLSSASLVACTPRVVVNPEQHAWEQQARRVTIARDDWGIPHVHGKTDADAVFGLVYAQSEDDFPRVEANVLKALGRMAEAEGDARIWEDLRMRLIVDPAAMQALYGSSPGWLQKLLTAWADGLNFYLATHPSVKPKVLTRFEPWMALPFSEGSISWDIERSVSLKDLEAFYGRRMAAPPPATPTPAGQDVGGSNGFAISPKLSATGHALLLINPHTSFYFRAEVQVQSEEGLNAYGAVTWGQFFVYQGFNERLGWMHTSSNADVVDEYAETIVEKPGGLFYKYGADLRPVVTSPVSIRYRTGSGLGRREFTVYRTHHGPIIRQQNGRWISVKLMQEPVKALTQSFLATKARTFDEFKALLDLQANSSNNTVYADGDGNIAFFLANFIPQRSTRFDWTRPVDGSDPATEWQGLHPVDTLPNLRNPPAGWIQNTNNWPYSAAGPGSPQGKDYPSYMDQEGENARGIHAVRVLSGRQAFTLDSLIATAFDDEMPAFRALIPPLLAAYRGEPDESPLKAGLRPQIAVLEKWDQRWSAGSVPTTLAIMWASELRRRASDGPSWFRWEVIRAAAANQPARVLLEALAAASDRLEADFGTWEVPWGEVNRFQRLTGGDAQPFSDSKPSTPVPFTDSVWGSFAAFRARTYPGTRRMYGTSGNTFVAVVEFGPTVRARAITTGGESSDPGSPHFIDQAERYAGGALRDVYFSREDLERHLAREYHPGT